MTGKQQTVMWMGLLLILLRLFSSGQWKAIWKTVLSGEGSGSGGSNFPLLPPPVRSIPDAPGGGAPEAPSVPELPAVPELPMLPLSLHINGSNPNVMAV